MIDVTMHDVSSMTIQSVGYDEGANILYVRFIGGAKYAYYDVSQYVYDELLDVNEPGTYVREHLDDQYRHEKVE